MRDDQGERLCFLSGHRVVVGDRVRWTDAPGEGGKIVEVEPRDTELRRVDPRGETQVLAANLGGLLIAVAAADPPFFAPLLDRYVVAARHEGLDAAIVLTKTDLGVPRQVEDELELREAEGIRVFRISIPTGVGLESLRNFLASSADRGPWALVGYSGVGKTSLIGALLPDQDVGPIGAISDYWGTGRHTTTWTRLFVLPDGGEIADSPGIRGFIPASLDPIAIRDAFPGLGAVQCRYRDCLHRSGEDGCTAEQTVDPRLLESYRRLIDDAAGIRSRRQY